MRILVVGANGDIGGIVCDALSPRHEVIRAGRSGPDVSIDIADPKAVQDMYAKIGPLDAVISTAGDVHFALLSEQTHATYMTGLQSKTMGQVNLVLGGVDHLTEGGSFTLTSGVLDRDPIPMGSGAAMANGALAGFVTGASIEMPRGLRLNVVSPGVLQASLPRYGVWFPGHRPVSDKDVALAYIKSVEGKLTGQVIIVE